MAGREYEIIAGGNAEPAVADVARVVSGKITALPTFAPGTGPFGRSPGRWSQDPSGLSEGERAAAASLYAAFVTETCLSLAGAEGPVVVEGPFAGNATFLGAVAQIVPRPVIARPDATGTTDGAALLALGPSARPDLQDRPAVEPLAIDLSAYAATWRERANA
jgi:sugar (pentulose or hexulose) kinase